MDAHNLFDFEKYISGLAASNKLAQVNNFHFCTCSGIESLQGPLDEFCYQSAFICVDDTNDGAMFSGRGGGFYKKRTCTVFILHRYEFRNMADRSKALALCREVFRQLMSRMVVDADDLSNELIYLDTSNVMCRELGQYFLNGCTGLYFMVDVSEPVDLKYDSSLWLT